MIDEQRIIETITVEDNELTLEIAPPEVDERAHVHPKRPRRRVHVGGRLVGEIEPHPANDAGWTWLARAADGSAVDGGASVREAARKLVRWDATDPEAVIVRRRVARNAVPATVRDQARAIGFLVDAIAAGEKNDDLPAAAGEVLRYATTLLTYARHDS